MKWHSMFTIMYLHFSLSPARSLMMPITFARNRSVPDSPKLLSKKRLVSLYSGSVVKESLQTVPSYLKQAPPLTEIQSQY